MIVKGTYFQNDAERPLVYGDVEIRNIPRQRLRGEKEKDGILAESVFVGFCGTDHTLMNMGREGNLKEKFPAGCDRLVNGHEGVVWVPSENRFAIVLIREETAMIRQDIQRKRRILNMGAIRQTDCFPTGIIIIRICC